MKAMYGKTVRLSIVSWRAHRFKLGAPCKELGLTGPMCCAHGSYRMPTLNDLTPATLTKQKSRLSAEEVEAYIRGEIEVTDSVPRLKALLGIR